MCISAEYLIGNKLIYMEINYILRIGEKKEEKHRPAGNVAISSSVKISPVKNGIVTSSL